MLTQSKIDKRLNELANTIRLVGRSLDEIDELVETEKWGQRSFLPRKPRTGTTVRIGQASDTEVAMYVHCQTTLVDTYRTLFPHLKFQGNRAILFDAASPLPKSEIKICVEAALLYHLHKRKTTAASHRPAA